MADYETIADNRYLRGAFAPVTGETSATELEVHGELPPVLSGTYVRNGPNPATTPRAMSHWFLGDGMLHGVRIEGGRARWYRNRYMRTHKLATEAGFDEAERPETVNPFNPANTSVVAHAGRRFALCEAGLPFEFGPQLESVGPWDYGGAVTAAMVAHPKIDPSSGELLSVGYSAMEPFLTFFRIGADGVVRRSFPIDMPRSVMVHDCAVTERFLAVYDMPVCFDPQLLARPTFPYRWDPDASARIGLVPRDAAGGDEVKWFEVDAGYVFHTVNSYDRPDGTVVIDAMRYPEVFQDMDGATRFGPLSGCLPQRYRYTIEPVTGEVTEDVVDDRPNEFPRVDERFTGSEYRYAFGVGLEGSGPGGDVSFTGVVSHDLDTGAHSIWVPGPGRTPCETTFVPAGDAAAEGDGWLIGFVNDETAAQAELVVLSATDVAAGPVASVRIPARVPLGFHGTWFPDRA